MFSEDFRDRSFLNSPNCIFVELSVTSTKYKEAESPFYLIRVSTDIENQQRSLAALKELVASAGKGREGLTNGFLAVLK